jgi:hypothetical protein
MLTPREAQRSMVVSEVCGCVYRKSFRARMARRSTEVVARESIANWQEKYQDWQAEDIETDLTHRVKECAFGPVISFILFAALSAVIKVVVMELIYWFIERRDERGKLLCELRG